MEEKNNFNQRLNKVLDKLEGMTDEEIDNFFSDVVLTKEECGRSYGMKNIKIE